MENNQITNTAPASSSNWKAYAVGGTLAAMLLPNATLLVRGSKMEVELNKVRTATSSEIAGLKEAHGAQAASAQQSMQELTAQLEQAKANSRNFAMQQARVNADRVAKSTAALVSSISEQQKAEAEKVTAALGELKQNAETGLAQVNGKVGEVVTEVGTVKTELGATKSTLDQTIAELKTVRGDLGVQSGLVATNAKELAALRELGERNYYEFTLSKSQPAATLAGVNLKLRKADAKRNKFNLDLVADDKRVEKKDKTLHEPVQFYMSGARQPYEILVNEIGKDKITG
ncbi:MAG: hypothetical protein FJW31_01815 [Acidobacteria bacterium]|nr:hypothetical protein [Acidobacteriota bacterium]